ncbi:MAG: hypothetical protein JW740_01365 [Candidatus Zambryskibacteria bacterium]|nr:hypothetical protein [Candidatus Zambryskibacteria bacterium]
MEKHPTILAAPDLSEVFARITTGAFAIIVIAIGAISIAKCFLAQDPSCFNWILAIILVIVGFLVFLKSLSWHSKKF